MEKTQKSKGNNHLQPSYKLLFMVCIVMLMSISLISAFEFDNRKEVLEKEGLAGYKDIKIGNLFGFGATLWEGTLDSNTDTCGINCEAIQTITLHDKGSLVDEVIFKTLQEDGKWVEQPIRSYKIQIYTEAQPYQVDDYETQCREQYDAKNDTYYNVCEWIKIGEHTEYTSEWQEYNIGEEKTAGEYEIKLIGQKKPTRTIDWIYKTQGETLNAWAIWGSIGGGDNAEITFNSPTLDNYRSTSFIFPNDIQFNATSEIITGRVVNMSLMHNATGVWHRNQTNLNPLINTFASFTTNDSDLTLGSNSWTAQSFIAGSSGTMNKLGVNMKRTGVTGVLTATLHLADGIGKPTGAILSSNLSVVTSGWSTGFLWYNITMSDYDLIAGTNYSIVLNVTTNAPNNLNHAALVAGWSGGEGWRSTDNGGTWFVVGDYAVNLEIFGTGESNLTTSFNSTIVNSTDYFWEACDSDGDCGFSVNRTVHPSFISVSSETYNTSTFETASETFSINVTANSSLTAASLIYKDGTSYAATQSGTLWSKTIDVPIGIATNTFNWSFTYGGNTINSASKTQFANATNFSICGGVGGSVPFLNFTYKDESDNTVILNGTIPSSTWVYYLGSGTTNKTYNFINNTANLNYAFCAIPTDKNLTIDGSLQYEDQEGTYIQRLLNPPSASFSNATTNTTLYLLKSTDGIYVTFQVLNSAEQPVSGTAVTGTRVISGSTVTVASGTTDAAGAVTFFLDSNFEHTFLFEATGFEDTTFVVFPTQSSYTVTLGSGVVAPADDFNNGIIINVNPSNVSLVNDTAYTFEFILNSSTWTVTEFGFVLFNSTGQSVATTSVATNGGTASTVYNVGNTTDYILMQHYYIISGNYTNSTRQWYVFSSDGTGFGIKNFFDRFDTYTDSGLFGMGDFAKGILVFLIIFIFVGIMSYKYGLITPAGIATLTFGLVLFFDYLGLIPRIGNSVVGFPTIFMGLILVGILFREVWR